MSLKTRKKILYVEFLHTFLEKLFSKKIGDRDSIIVPVGIPASGELNPGTPMVTIRLKEIFHNQTLLHKMHSLLSEVKVTEEEIKSLSYTYFINEIFGDVEDFGVHLFLVNHMRLSEDTFIKDFLTEGDQKRAEAISTFSFVTARQIQEHYIYPPLNLQMAKDDFAYCSLTIPMTTMVLVHSIRFHIELNCFYTFAAIRRSPHPYKDDLISFLYEISNLQLKTSLSIFEFHKKCAESQKLRKVEKANFAYNDDLFSIMDSDKIVSYLKATIEKIIAFIGIIFGIEGIDNKKRHVQRVNLLNEKLKERTKNTPYGILLLEYIKSENLEELNNYRTGILHKKGSSKMQPHSYIGIDNFDELPLRDLLDFFKHHHFMNSKVYLGALAMLADEVMDIRLNAGEDLHEEKNRIIKMMEAVFNEANSLIKDDSK